MKKLPRGCERLYPGAYRIADALDVYMFLIVGDEKALLIDTGYGTTDLKSIVPLLLRDAAGDKADSIELMVCNTHGHIDHNGLDYAYPACYISRAEADVYKLHADPAVREDFVRKTFGRFYPLLSRLPILKGLICTICHMEPARLLPMPESFELGGRTIRVIETPGHTPGSVCLLDEKQKALFSGDTVCDECILLMVDYACSVAVYRDSIERLLRMHDGGEFDIIYPSHHKRNVLDRSFLADYITLCDIILSGKAEGVYESSPAGEGWRVDFKSISITYKKDKVR